MCLPPFDIFVIFLTIGISPISTWRLGVSNVLKILGPRSRITNWRSYGVWSRKIAVSRESDPSEDEEERQVCLPKYECGHILGPFPLGGPVVLHQGDRRSIQRKRKRREGELEGDIVPRKGPGAFDDLVVRIKVAPGSTDEESVADQLVGAGGVGWMVRQPGG
eukprot:5257-Prorocentrum_minimum.AAC.2